MDRERGEGVNRSEGPQPSDGRPPSLVDCELSDVLVQLQLPSGESIDAREQIEIDQLTRRLVEVLSGQPTAVVLLPGRWLGINPSVTQQHLRETVACAHQIPPARVMQASQLAGGFDPGWWDHHRLELSRDQQPGEQLGVLAVSLDAIRRSARCLAWRDHIHP
jgi:hypothetical protein